MKFDGEVLELIEEFESHFTKVSTHKDFYKKSGHDNDYEFHITLFRRPGMGNSVQLISGDKHSILVGITSFLNTLYSRGILDDRDLFEVFRLAVADTKTMKEELDD